MVTPKGCASRQSDLFHSEFSTCIRLASEMLPVASTATQNNESSSVSTLMIGASMQRSLQQSGCHSAQGSWLRSWSFAARKGRGISKYSTQQLRYGYTTVPGHGRWYACAPGLRILATSVQAVHLRNGQTHRRRDIGCMNAKHTPATALAAPPMVTCLGA